MTPLQILCLVFIALIVLGLAMMTVEAVRSIRYTRKHKDHDPLP